MAALQMATIFGLINAGMPLAVFVRSRNEDKGISARILVRRSEGR
jgi:hypothetical protein